MASVALQKERRLVVGASSEFKKESDSLVYRDRARIRRLERIGGFCRLAPTQPEVPASACFSPVLRTGGSVEDSTIFEFQLAGCDDGAGAIGAVGTVLRRCTCRAWIWRSLRNTCLTTSPPSLRCNRKCCCSTGSAAVQSLGTGRHSPARPLSRLWHSG